MAKHNNQIKIDTLTPIPACLKELSGFGISHVPGIYNHKNTYTGN